MSQSGGASEEDSDTHRFGLYQEESGAGTVE
jgi:hypothetical protein